MRLSHRGLTGELGGLGDFERTRHGVVYGALSIGIIFGGGVVNGVART